MKRWATLLAVLALAFGVVDTRAAETAAGAVLQRAVEDLDRAKAATDADRSELIESVIRAVQSEPSIGISDWLLAPLRSSPPDLELGRARFTAAIDALGPSASSGQDVTRRLALDDVLSGPPFQTRDVKSLSPEWLLPVALLVEWLARNISNMVHWPFDRLGELIQAFIDGPAFAPLITMLAIGAVLSLAQLYRRGLRAALVSETELTPDGEPLPPTSAQAHERSRRLASDGRYRDACHFILLSALLWIEEHGQTRFERSATNWEHLQRLDRQSPAAPPLRGLVDRFDRLWYGQSDVSATDYRDLEELAGRVRQAVA